MANDKADDQSVFLDISVYLTGFSKIELQGTGMLETYFNTINANTNPLIVNAFYEEVRHILALDNDKKIEEAIAEKLMPLDKYEGLAQQSILMWYMGTWSTLNYDEKTNTYSLINGVVVSANAYTQGLVWEAAETHPPAAKQPGYDSWAHPPIKINC